MGLPYLGAGPIDLRNPGLVLDAGGDDQVSTPQRPLARLDRPCPVGPRRGGDLPSQSDVALETEAPDPLVGIAVDGRLVHPAEWNAVEGDILPAILEVLPGGETVPETADVVLFLQGDGAQAAPRA